MFENLVQMFIKNVSKIIANSHFPNDHVTYLMSSKKVRDVLGAVNAYLFEQIFIEIRHGECSNLFCW